MRIGEVTIVVPDSWKIEDVTKVTERRTLSEADIVFTDDPTNLDRNQILTMQYGECGEPGLPIQFAKKFLSYNPRLLAHQWLLYRYGVFNEFGIVDDDTYPVYFRPIDGGALEQNSTKSLVNSCTDKDDFLVMPICQNMEIDPNTGRPLTQGCDIVPRNDTVSSSFLYAPLAVSEKDFHICDASSHDYSAPNKQNILCDNRSPFEVIRTHKDFEDFPLGGKPNVPAAIPIKFKILQRHSPINGVSTDESKLGHVFYAHPPGFRFASYIYVMLQKFYDTKFFQHMAMVAWTNGEEIVKRVDKWVPSKQIPTENPDTDVTPKPSNLNSIFGNIINQFNTETSKNGGTIVFIHSGNFTVTSMADSDTIIEKLAERLNSLNIGVKVIVIDKIPENFVVEFFDKLTRRLTSGKSSVYYAVAPQTSDVIAQSRVFSEMMTYLFDSLQETTEQSHILLKRETFSVVPTKTKDLQLKFSVDSGFHSSDMAQRWLAIELYSPQEKIVSVVKSRLYAAHDNSVNITSEYAPDGRDPHFGHLIFKGSDLKANVEYIFSAQANQISTASGVSIAARMFSTYNSYRSYYSEAPVAGSCWVQSSLNRFPLRGYVEIGQGLNGRLFDADVTMTVRRFTTSGTVQEFQIPLSDNGHASPDLTERDGIFSAYLDNVLSDLPESDVVFQVSAKVTSSKVSIKPGNFGNTVLFGSRKRCCGSSLGESDDDIKQNSNLERVFECGSFHVSLNNQASINRQGYAIRDLRIAHIDSANRTVTIEWNSPFMPSVSSLATEQSGEVKFFYSKDIKTNLPLTIKTNFATENGAEIELLYNKTTKQIKRRSVEHSPTHLDSLPENILDSGSFIQDEEENGYVYGENISIHDRHLQREYQASNLAPNSGELANSLRTATFRVKHNEAGYYFIAVQERDGSKQTRPSNVVVVYLKSNVELDKNNAFAIEQGQMTGID